MGKYEKKTIPLNLYTLAKKFILQIEPNASKNIQRYRSADINKSARNYFTNFSVLP
jgi:hypothetical protein